MRRTPFAHLVVGLAATWLVAGVGRAERSTPGVGAGLVPPRVAPAAPQTSSATPTLVRDFCVTCHNDMAMRGNLSLVAFDAERPEANPELAEKMIRKLRTGMMPPPGSRRPEPAVLEDFVSTMERRIDGEARQNPNPGVRPFQRMNRAEYERTMRDLLALDVDASAFLPPDTLSAGFDNIADVQNMSATLLDGYLRAAEQVSRLAVGDPDATAAETTYEIPRYAEQRGHVEGTPLGTRGGVAVVHTFPADGTYVFRVSFAHESTGNMFGDGRGALQTADQPEQVEISINGSPVALLDVDRWGHRQRPESVEMKTPPIFVRAGPQRVAAAFLRRAEGPVEDLLAAHDWSLADKKIGCSYGISTLPHVQDLAITGPNEVAGVSDTPSRRRIFSCRPSSAAEAPACADEILTRLATRAYRRPLRAADVQPLMGFYEIGATEGGFDIGIRTALQAMLASPDFIFRFEEPDRTVAAGDLYRLSDVDLASRLSFFLWGSVPDLELLDLAARQGLRAPGALELQVRRMLADPRAEALGSRFASQWLRLQDLDKVHPDSLAFPDFHQQLSDGLKRETTTFFNHLVAEDRPVLDLLTADYTFVDERVARHYGMPGVVGTEFRRVPYPDDSRRGLLGHGSILTLTSHANRTSPVLRGKWVMEVLLGSPPPPPPPDVPDLDDTAPARDGRVLSTRERLEEHRANPTCDACHRFMDPIGLALDGFDVIGRWRIRDNDAPVDTRGEMYDGTPVNNPSELRTALLNRSDVIVTNFTQNLMAYALGRRVEHFDMPTVRAIIRRTETDNHRLSSLILGVATSDAFSMGRLPPDPPGGRR